MCEISWILALAFDAYSDPLYVCMSNALISAVVNIVAGSNTFWVSLVEKLEVFYKNHNVNEEVDTKKIWSALQLVLVKFLERAA